MRWLYQVASIGSSPEKTTSGMRACAAVASAVMIWVSPGPQVTEAIPTSPVARAHAVAIATAACSCRTWKLRTSGSAARAASQCMLPSPVRLNTVRTPSA